MSWRAHAFVVAVEAGDATEARRLTGVATLADQEPDLAVGVFMPRDDAPSLHRLSELARSWEQIDRVYVRSPQRVPSATRCIEAFLDATSLARDWGDDHLFIGDDGLLIAWPGEHWRRVAHSWAARQKLNLEDADFVAFHARARDLGL